MNRGVMQSPSWWSHANNTMRPPTSHHHHHHHHDNHHHHQESANSTSSSPFMAHPDHIPHNLFPHLTPPQLPTPSSTHSLPFSSWINDSQLRLPPPADSWSQLILGGLVVDGDKSDGMANWEGQQQLLSQGTTTFDTKQQNVINTSAANSCYIYGGGIENNADFLAKPSTNYNNNNNNWSQSSPSKSCITTLSCTDTMLNSSNTIVMSPRARHPPPDHSSECISTATTGGAPKKPRLQPSSSSQSTFKVRKEKLGDRITALHQLVSPFGKTDTASVLLEAIGYVRFLQSQIEALSLPYLATATSHDQTISHHQQSTVIQGEMNTLFPEDPGQVSSNEESKKDLKSRGLCLVPISSTLQVGNNNGADYWAPTPYGGVGFL
ncbi:unnamed protein product [Cuscuta epithymum]|uniref:BHLH domain-containing protein n=1 Tax=Cuscuta epithymum TaxID=186058 RepID=A0AAV0DHP5_9ASTE|nr:unnamed protein product [Cuscuta epithymum]